MAFLKQSKLDFLLTRKGWERNPLSVTPLSGPFRHINRDGYGGPWIVAFHNCEYAVGFVDAKTPMHCAVITKSFENSVVIVAQKEGFPSAEDAEQWARHEIRQHAAPPSQREPLTVKGKTTAFAFTPSTKKNSEILPIHNDTRSTDIPRKH